MNPRTLTLLAALGCALPAITPAVAQAGEVEEAEHRRIREEMKRLASRNAWAGVERNFQELLALQAKSDVEISYEEWRLGAQAAQNLGDMQALRDRLAQAVRIEGKEEDIAWLEQIDKNFGSANLRSVDKDSVPTLTIAAMPFAADQRAALEYAQKQLAEKRAFRGLLPPGDYTFDAGGVSETFTITAGSLEATTVKLTPSGEGGSGALSYVGPRVDLGGAFTISGTPLVENDFQTPPGFSGAGARAGVGVEAGFKRGFGVMAMVGYHNLLSGSDRPDLEGVPNLGDNMHLGYGALGPTLRLKGVQISAGGVLALGVARASGVNSADKLNIQCPYGSEEAACSWVSDVPEAQREYYPWSGKLTTSGFQAQLGYGFLDVGKSLTAGVSVSGGMLFDPDRNYPWGQVALSIAPVPARSE
jgi:hypothetical protein